ncbi:hypothetical protein FQN57_000871 [Myotisia sp. PD_48]|nr:hypothetical protein FQN57_000871 [Myotisia sp. PD_48]
MPNQPGHPQPPRPAPSSASRSSSGVFNQGRQSIYSAKLNATSIKATTALIRRVLCSQSNGHGVDRKSPRPLEELLPPLTSSNEIDLQLYALIAIVMKEYVHSWYSKITPDVTFTEEVVQIIAHCTRALEERCRQIEVEILLFDEIPALIEAHIVAYRTARQTHAASGSNSHLRTVYHVLNPHPVLSPVPEFPNSQPIGEQVEKERVYRQLLAHGVMAILLPTEDLENTCLTTLIGDILADLLLGEIVSEKAAQGWFIWETLLNILADLNQQNSSDGGKGWDQEGRPGDQKQRLDPEDHSSKRDQSFILGVVLNILQYCYLGYVAIQFVVAGLFRVAFVTPTSKENNGANEKMSRSNGGTRLPVLQYRIFSVLGEVIEISSRMPWLGGVIALVQHLLLENPWRVGDTDGILDRFLHDSIHRYLLTPTLIPSLLLAIRTKLFPFNARPSSGQTFGVVHRPSTPNSDAAIGTPGTNSRPNITQNSNASQEEWEKAQLNTTPLQDTATGGISSSQLPSDLEIRSIKRACASNLLSLIPRSIAIALFGTQKETNAQNITTESGVTISQKSNAAKPQVNHASIPMSPAVYPISTALPELNSVSNPGPASDSNPSQLGSKSSLSARIPRLNHGHDHDSTHPFPATTITASKNTSPGKNVYHNDDDNHDKHSAMSTGSDLALPPDTGSKFSATSTSNEIATQSSQAGTDRGEIDEVTSLLSAIEYDILDVFSDSYCNKHLIYSIVEAILVKLIPELSVQSVTELMAERGVPWNNETASHE